MGQRIGVFGGTFDPPHVGHLLVASAAFDELKLDRLIFIPASRPPHKPGVSASAEQRMRMTRAAVGDDSRFEVSDLELRREGVSYSVDTLRSLHGSNPEAELVFLLGVDQFRALPTWREPDEVAKLATLAVMKRGGEAVEVDTRYPWTAVDVPRIDLSSTEIRERVWNGRSIRYFVPDAVFDIVGHENLYKAPR